MTAHEGPPRAGIGRRWLAVAAVAAVAAGCGVRLDDAPRDLAADTVPFGLLDEATTTTTSEPQPFPRFQPTSVYLVNGDGFLEEVTRQLPGEPTAERAVGALLSQPSELELRAGLGTAISSSTELRSPIRGPDDGLVTIDLSSEISDVSPERVRLALAQIVFTATAVPGVDKVLFQVDGEARQVPNAAGDTAEPLTPNDYREFVRPSTTTTAAPFDIPDR